MANKPPLWAVVLLLICFGASAQQQPAPIQSPCPRAIRANTNYQFRGTLHFICLQATNSGPRLDVIQYNNRRVILSKTVDEWGTNQLASFVDDDGTLRILLAVPDRVNGTSLYSVDRNGQYVPESHTVSTQYVNQMSIWKLELNWEWQLAIANEPAYEPAIVHGRPIIGPGPPLAELKPMVSLYSWRSTYFDRYQLINLPQDGRVSKLEPMHINGQEFLIVAMDSNRPDKDLTFAVDSLIYKLDFGSGDLEWTEFGRLPTRFAHDVKPFTLQHKSSLQRDYYIAVLGRRKVTRDFHTTGARFNVTDEEDGLIIYKYLGDRFEQTNAFPAPDMTKLEAINYGVGDTYVIVALLSERTRQVSLLSFDGLDLRTLSVPSMMPIRRPSHKHRRTMTNVQLFLAPPDIDLNQNNETGPAKRTLNADNQQAKLTTTPVLAISDPDLDHLDTLDHQSSSSETRDAYQIPESELIANDQATVGDNSNTKRNFIPALGEDLLNWCKVTINSILMDNFDSLSKQLLVLPRVDQNRPIELIGDLIVEDDLHISNLLHVNRVEETHGLNQQHVMIENNPSNFSHTFNEIQRVHKEIDDVKHRIDQILVDDNTDQDFFNQVAFDTLIVECHNPPASFDPRNQYLPYDRVTCPHINEIRTSHLNNHNITDIHRQALLTGRSMIIERDVRFEHLILRGPTNITHTLNGIPINDIVFKKGPAGQPIMGHKDFKNGLYSQSHLNVANWRGLRINRAAFLTSSGDQTIPSIRFTHVIIDSSRNYSSHIKRLNGLDLGVHLSQIALSDADNHFEIPIQFDELILNGPIHMVGGLSRLSSINLEDLWRHTMFKHLSQNVSVPMDFAGPVHVSYGGNIIVDGLVNGFWLKPREVLMRDMDFELPNPIFFEGNIDVRDLFVAKALNGIQVLINPKTQRPELQILYNQGEQIITGDKVLGSIYLGGQSSISGNINGHLNLSQLHGLATSFGQTHRFQKIRLSGNDIRIAERAHVHIESTINGVPMGDLCSLAQHTSGKNHSTYRSLRFEQPVYFRSLRCSSINGFTNLSRTFMTKFGDQHILGSLRLTNGAIFNTTVQIQSALNGLNVGYLARAIGRSLNETGSGHKDFFGDLILDDLFTDRINELRLSSVFLAKADQPQLVRAPLTFDHLDIENVLTVGNLNTNFFNNLNVTDVITNTLTYDTPQVIYNHIQLDTLQLMAKSNLQTNSVNGRNLRRVYSDTVFYDAPQQIMAPKTFRGPVEFADRTFLRHRIDGLSFEDIRANLLLLSDDLIAGDLVLNNDCTIRQNLEIQSKTINDIDLDAFVRNMISDGQPLRVAANGSIRFHDVRANDIVVGGTIQGVDLSRDAILRSQNQQPPPSRRPAAGLKPNDQFHPTEASFVPLPPPPPPPQSAGNRPTAIWRPQQPQMPIIMQGNYQLIPNVMPPPPMSLVNSSRPASIWRPQLNLVQHPVAIVPHLVMPHPPPVSAIQDDYNSIMKAHAISDLSQRINRHLSISFYYETVQKLPLLGPLLYYGRDLLFLKATGNPGEPCLHRGQTVAIWSRKVQQPLFYQTSRIQETSDPRSMASVADFLFVLDDNPVSQVLVYIWDNKADLYELQERIAMDEKSPPPVTIKAFMSGQTVCLAIVSSSPTLFCQPKPGSRLTDKTILKIRNVADLDVHTIHASSQILIATISNQDTEQIGDLTVVMFDTKTKVLTAIASKRLIRPLKLHFFRNGLWSPDIQLAVSEAITSNDNVQATSRIFSMRLGAGQYFGPAGGFSGHGNAQNNSHFHQVQEIRDNQFYDIQSVLLDDSRSLVLFQSAHSISIYAPSTGAGYSPGCDAQYSLIQRIPTKGANKFLVFNNNQQLQQQQQQPQYINNNNNNGTNSMHVRPFAHYLVLSKDECDEKQQYATLILKAQFK